MPGIKKFCVGLTGRIASGKSTVARCFHELGVDVISADQISRQLTMKNQPAFHQIVQHFGPSVLTDSDELNRSNLRQIIFKNPKERAWIEALLHPLIRASIQKKINESQAPYCLVEIPLIPHKIDDAYLNRILLVLANQQAQIARLMTRDNMTQADAETILNAQADLREYRAHADDILVNHGSIERLKNEVLKLHHTYLSFLTSRNFCPREV